MIWAQYLCRLLTSNILLSETAMKRENKVIILVKFNHLHCRLLQKGIMSAKMSDRKLKRCQTLRSKISYYNRMN